MSLLSKIFSDPIFHFIAIGSLLFVFEGKVFTTVKPEYHIEIDQARIEWIKQTSKKENGYFPNEQALDRLIDNDIRNEILFREALSIGLEKDDVIIRRRLIEKFTFMLEGTTNTSIPSNEELHAFYLNNADLFMLSERYSFSHYYFSEDSRANAQTDAREALLELTNHTKVSSNNHKIGDPFIMQYHYKSLDSTQLKNNFGELFTKNLIAKRLDANQWFGPIKSIFGWHLVKITNLQNTHLPAYQAIKETVLTKYLNQQRIAANNALYETLLAKYQISVAGVEQIK